MLSADLGGSASLSCFMRVRLRVRLGRKRRFELGEAQNVVSLFPFWTLLNLWVPRAVGAGAGDRFFKAILPDLSAI